MKTWGEIEKYLLATLGPSVLVSLKRMVWRDENIETEMQISTGPAGGGVHYYDADACSPLSEEDMDILRSWRVVSLKASPSGHASSLFKVVLRKPDRLKPYMLKFQSHLLSSHDTEEDAKAAKYDAIHIHGYDERGLNIEGCDSSFPTLYKNPTHTTGWSWP